MNLLAPEPLVLPRFETHYFSWQENGGKIWPVCMLLWAFHCHCRKDSPFQHITLIPRCVFVNTPFIQLLFKASIFSEVDQWHRTFVVRCTKLFRFTPTVLTAWGLRVNGFVDANDHARQTEPFHTFNITSQLSQSWHNFVVCSKGLEIRIIYIL